MQPTRARPVVAAPITDETAELRWFFGNLVHVKLRGEDTGGAYALTEHWGDEGDMPPLHLHRSDDETFYVLDGELEFYVEGAAPVRLGAGGTVLAPRGVPHSYRVLSEGGARWLLITSPGEFEQFVAEVSTAALAATVPPMPDGPPPAEAIEQLNATARRHGIEILGPPGTLPATG